MKQIIFISPHFDDICFSLAGMLPDIRVPQKTLLNLYTRSGWVSNPEIRATLESTPRPQRDTAIDHIRDVEDDAFAAAFNCEKTNLNFLDAYLIAPAGFSGPAQYYENMEEEAAALQDKLQPLLQSLIDREPHSVLMAPLAIGEHRNHLVTFAVMVKIAAVLSPQVPLMFYEDLPYAVEAPKRQKRLATLEAYLRAKNYQRYRKDMDAAAYQRKTGEVAKYKSQMSRSLEEYAIRTPECPERHEAIWSNAGGAVTGSLF